ncbi:MAG: hypothetical protein CMH83_09180 [Nocardioides sp.]|nr:hypothetical protein [Nocardioides sp.]
MRSHPRTALVAGLVCAAVAVAGCADPDSVPSEASPAPTVTVTETVTAAPSDPPAEAGSPSDAPSPSSTPTAPTSTPEPSAARDQPAYSTWVLGSVVLPEDERGFGEVRPTPPSLRNRRYPTEDLLPPPTSGRFESSTGPVTAAVRKRMGETWSPACPVGLDELRYVTVSFRGFDGFAHTGELVVAASEADGLVQVFRRLYRAGFPIEEMRLVSTADLDAPPTGDGNDTAAYVCRPVTGETTRFSQHAYGLAIDVNPFQNPYEKGDVVLPELASSYLDRGRVRPGMVTADSLVVRAFADIGWSWGGAWNSLKDYQHFSANGL